MKKPDCAVALSYSFGQKAPIIVAKGSEQIAREIVKIAEKHGIKIVEEAALAQVLSQEKIGSCIPEETYEAVAAIFAFLDNAIEKYAPPQNN